MSPFEFDEYRSNFVAAAELFGWERKTVEMHHERDESQQWDENVWIDRDGEFLFSEDDLSEGLCKNIIHIASLITHLRSK